MTPSAPPNEAKHDGDGSASIHDRARGEILGGKPVLTPPRTRSLSSPGDFYASHLVLLRKLDQAYDEQGVLDPLTWTEVDAQILEGLEQHRLSVGQYIQLHAHVENRLRRAGGGWG